MGAGAVSAILKRSGRAKRTFLEVAMTARLYGCSGNLCELTNGFQVVLRYAIAIKLYSRDALLLR